MKDAENKERCTFTHQVASGRWSSRPNVRGGATENVEPVKCFTSTMTDQVAGLENARKCPAIWSVIFKSCKFSTHPHFSLLELFFLSENFFCENTKFGAQNPQFADNSGAKFKHPHVGKLQLSVETF